jgi:predicted RNase H-like HicB family nuclease
MKYTAIFEEGPTSWGAYIPDLPGCIAVGETRREVETLIREATALHLEALQQAGQQMPRAASTAKEFSVKHTRKGWAVAATKKTIPLATKKSVR